jgi:hypothetical protein
VGLCSLARCGARKPMSASTSASASSISAASFWTRNPGFAPHALRSQVTINIDADQSNNLRLMGRKNRRSCRLPLQSENRSFILNAVIVPPRGCPRQLKTSRFSPSPPSELSPPRL